MKTYLDCLHCFLSQALRAARIATDDEKKIKDILNEVGMLLRDIPLASPPPESGRLIYHKICEMTGNPDPYREIKSESTKEALSLYPFLKGEVEKSEDRLFTAIKIAIAGNIIDAGANWDFDIRHDVGEVLNKDFAICDYGEFIERLNKARKVLYIGDNAGECVFDRILIEEMKKPTTYAVRGAPIINDATYADALQAGINKVATIMSSGTDGPGTVLERCSEVFKTIYKHSDLVISKGQGNYEALSNEKHSIFFLLIAKCQIIARDIGVTEGDIVLKAMLGRKASERGSQDTDEKIQRKNAA